MIHFSKHFPLLLGFACCLAFMALAQEEKKDPLDNFDGSKKEITVANPEAQKGTEASESGSGQISLGELSEDKIKEDKVTKSRENELETNAQEEKKDPLDNFDGSKKEITVANPEAQKGTVASESGSGQISLGELSEDKINEDKVTEFRENELETINAKSDQTKDLIQSALATLNRPLSASGLELNQPEVFPVDI